MAATFKISMKLCRHYPCAHVMSEGSFLPMSTPKHRAIESFDLYIFNIFGLPFHQYLIDQRQMFYFILNKPIELKVGDQILKFSTLADYEFCMSGRTAIPSSKITDLVKFSTEQLKKEARTIKDIEKRFVSILSKSIEDPASINRALRELDPLIFSQDHSWRDIISGLNNGDDALNPYRRIALVKYMQYLSSRQEIIKYLYNEKKQNYKVGADTYSGMSESAEFKETLLLDNTVFEPGAQDLTKENAFERMPKGEAITIILAPTEEIDILLSKHKCKLAAQNGIQFIDQAGRVYKLNKGKNLIRPHS